jgi:uncharacterized membrane protein
MKFRLLQGVASLGALAQIYFAYKETVGWGREFVDKAAPAWTKPKGPNVPADPNIDAHIEWARDLAFNMGIYNLVLAIGLAWTVVAAPTMARSLGFFFSAWLLIAAAAACYTQVYSAAALQGGIGLLLLMASAWSRPTPV